MFIKCQHISLTKDVPEPIFDVYLNPDHLCSVEPLLDAEFFMKYWRVRTAGNDTFIITAKQAEQIVNQKIGTWDAPEVAAATPVTTPRLAPEQPIVNLDSFKAMLQAGHYVVLDTETTGLEDGEIVQIAIVHSSGQVLLDTFVKPKKPIPADATRIHGITNEMVANAPTWEIVRGMVEHEILGEHVVIYNAVYDRKMMHKSSERWGLPKTEYKDIAAFWCAMEMFAAVYGDWNEYRGNYRWQKLSTAAAHYSIEQTEAHTALADCLTTLAVCKAMAGA